MRSLVIERDPDLRATLCELLANQAEIKRVDESGDCALATQLLSRGSFDVALLNIGAEELVGIEQLLRLPKSRLPQFIFLSDRFPDIDFAGTGIILHPRAVTSEQLAGLLQRVKVEASDTEGVDVQEQLRFIIEHSAPPKPSPGQNGNTIMPHLQRILVRVGNDNRIITAEEIDWVESADHYVYLHASGRSHLLYATMNDLEKRLHPDKFIRAHRGAIVNVDSVRKVTTGKFGTLLLTLADDSEVTQVKNEFQSGGSV